MRAQLFLITTFLLFAACSSDPPVTRSCTFTSDCPTGDVCVDNMCVASPDSGTEDATTPTDSAFDATLPQVTSIRLDPTMASLTAAIGERPMVDFSAFAVRDDGSESPLSGAVFELDSNQVGDVDPGSGEFTANGIAGGMATLRVSAPGIAATAEAPITVRIEETITGDGVPAGAPDLFAAPVDDEGRRAGMVYPLEGAVMPQNVYPADVQWLTGGATDTYRITLRKTHLEVQAYVISADRHWVVETGAWQALARTDPDEAATLIVDRHDGTDAIAGAPRQINFATAALTGTIYYWDIAAGRILRINDGTATAEAFMPTPPVARDGNTCVGCHSVSNSGRYMAGRLGGGENIGAVFDLTRDLSGMDPPTEFPLDRGEPSSARWWFSSWSPDDSRMVLSTNEGATRDMAFLDPFSGAYVPVTGTVPSGTTHPAWAPDGTQIAYVTAINSWGGAFTAGDIATIDVTGPDALGDARTVHTGASLSGSSPPGAADSYPTWTPDSAHIAFSHGSGTRSEDQQAALYIMNRDGTDTVRLDAANGDDQTNFQPRFSPFEGDGYFWLSFLSRRDYGNDVVGTRGRQLQQIWVTAIRTDAADGEDPSSVPYWIAGQRTSTRNISAYWAPRACREDGESCSVGSECCGGDCRPDDTGALVCSPPPPDRCRMADETCSTSDDCCDGLTCYERVCLPPLQ